jgi:hypothetical protein
LYHSKEFTQGNTTAQVWPARHDLGVVDYKALIGLSLLWVPHFHARYGASLKDSFSFYPLKAKYVDLMGKEKWYNSSHVYCQAKGWSKKSYEEFLNDLEKVFDMV